MRADDLYDLTLGGASPKILHRINGIFAVLGDGVV